MGSVDVRLIGPLTYRGKENCDSAICTRRVRGRENGKLIWDTTCMGWHCSYCDEPCSYQGHPCDAAEAVLGEARRAAMEE